MVDVRRGAALLGVHGELPVMYVGLRGQVGQEPGEVAEVHQAIVDRFRDCVLQKELDSTVQPAIAT